MTPDQPQPTVFEEEVEDRSTAQAASVKEYLQSVAAGEEAAPPPTQPQSVANDLLSEDTPQEVSKDTQPEEIHLQTDTTFVQNGIDNQSITSSVVVKDTRVEITEEDKESYMKALLLDTPVTLRIPCYKGTVYVTCRALSVYEINVSTMAGNQFVDEEKDSRMAALLLTGELQKVRIAMQITHINDIVQPTRSYKYEKDGTIEEHAKDLRTFANARLYDTPEQKWNLMISALNVFEHKLRRLNELSISGDFIVPLE